MKIKNNKTKKPSLWQILQRVGLAITLAILVIGITAQILFNVFVWRSLRSNETFKMAVLISSAIDNLDKLRTNLGDDNKIEEMRLQFPTQDKELDLVKYLYTPSETDGEFTTPQEAQVTIRSLADRSSVLLGQSNMNDLFETVPKIQSCARGFNLRFEKYNTNDNSDEIKLSGTVNLKDGRTLYVYREINCDASSGMNELESYLLKAQSY